MWEVNLLTVGEATRSGDAIMLRFSEPASGLERRVIIDAGYQGDGDRLVEIFVEYYRSHDVDAVICSHPDGDHIGGLGRVVRNLNVGTLAVHRPAAHGGGALRASAAVEDLVATAEERGVQNIVEPFAGVAGFNEALMIAGPTEAYYEALIQDQLADEGSGERSGTGRSVSLSESSLFQAAAAAVLPHLPFEVPFDDAGGDNARNNSSTIIDLRVGHERILLTSDAGVPALVRAAETLDASGRSDVPISYFQIPHHGSRHNLDTATMNRLLGPHRSAPVGWSFVSISAEAFEDHRYPSPRIVNASARRGYQVAATARQNLQLRSADVPFRPGYGPVTPLPPLDERIDDR